MKYDNWIKTVLEEITEDAVWNLKVYRAALYLSERCWNDTQQVMGRRYFSLADYSCLITYYSSFTHIHRFL